MDLRNLRLFLGVAATGSFSRTATLSGSTQSSVSKAIAALEQQLAVRLFDRTGRGVTLSAAGRTLLPRAEALLREADALPELMAGHGARPAGLVRLALQPSVAWPLVRELLSQTEERWPQVRLQVAEGTTQQIEQWLAEGQCDLGVMSRAPSVSHADSSPLFSVALLLVSRPDAAPTAGGPQAFANVARLPLVMATAPNGGRLLMEEEARRQGLRLNIAAEVNSGHLTKRLVESGPLYTVSNGPSIDDEVRAGRLRAVPICQPELRQTFHLALGGRRQPSAAVRSIADLVRNLVGFVAASGSSIPGGLARPAQAPPDPGPSRDPGAPVGHRAAANIH